jgi:hypothetical protein
MLKGHLLKHAVRLGEGSCAFRVAVTQMPDDTAADDGRQIHPFGKTLAVLFVSQNICRQRQVTVDQHWVVSNRGDGHVYTGRPKAYRFTNNPITMSCICVDFEKQI